MRGECWWQEERLRVDATNLVMTPCSDCSAKLSNYTSSFFRRRLLWNQTGLFQTSGKRCPKLPTVLLPWEGEKNQFKLIKNLRNLRFLSFSAQTSYIIYYVPFINHILYSGIQMSQTTNLIIFFFIWNHTISITIRVSKLNWKVNMHFRMS